MGRKDFFTECKTCMPKLKVGRMFLVNPVAGT